MFCLSRSTDPEWAAIAVRDLPSLLSDHAHCEMKAASNALSLAARWTSYPRLVDALAALAEEELRHFRAVLAELSRRGIPLGKPEVDVYAAELRKAASRRDRHSEGAALVDRLLVGALIEARSCERFRMLSPALQATGEGALAAFYDELFASEARHYTTFVDLAIDVASVGKTSAEDVRARLAELAQAEGDIVAKLCASPTMHG